jgi:hypothetical protein
MKGWGRSTRRSGLGEVGERRPRHPVGDPVVLLLSARRRCRARLRRRSSPAAPSTAFCSRRRHQAVVERFPQRASASSAGGMMVNFVVVWPTSSSGRIRRRYCHAIAPRRWGDPRTTARSGSTAPSGSRRADHTGRLRRLSATAYRSSTTRTLRPREFVVRSVPATAGRPDVRASQPSRDFVETSRGPWQLEVPRSL